MQHILYIFILTSLTSFQIYPFLPHTLSALFKNYFFNRKEYVKADILVLLLLKSFCTTLAQCSPNLTCKDCVLDVLFVVGYPKTSCPLHLNSCGFL